MFSIENEINFICLHFYQSVQNKGSNQVDGKEKSKKLSPRSTVVRRGSDDEKSIEDSEGCRYLHISGYLFSTFSLDPLTCLFTFLSQWPLPLTTPTSPYYFEDIPTIRYVCTVHRYFYAYITCAHLWIAGLNRLVTMVTKVYTVSSVARVFYLVVSCHSDFPPTCVYICLTWLSLQGPFQESGYILIPNHE